MFVYYCCKLLDFCDTLFMVLGKKTRQFTLLHVWHHASIVPLFGYYLSTGMGGGFIAALPLWNSLVHVIMYSHYLITSLYTFKRMWWKPIITASQMGHHMLIMMYMILNRVYVRTAANLAQPRYSQAATTNVVHCPPIRRRSILRPSFPAHNHAAFYCRSVLLQENPECTWAVCIYAVLWGFSILGLFAHFFLQSYLSPKSAKQREGAKPKGS